MPTMFCRKAPWVHQGCCSNFKLPSVCLFKPAYPTFLVPYSLPNTGCPCPTMRCSLVGLGNWSYATCAIGAVQKVCCQCGNFKCCQLQVLHAMSPAVCICIFLVCNCVLGYVSMQGLRLQGNREATDLFLYQRHLLW